MDLALTPDAAWLAYSQANPFLKRSGDIVLHDLDSGRSCTLATNESSVSLTFSADGDWLAAAIFASGEISVWRVSTRERVARFMAHRGPVVALGFSPDKRWLATGGYDQTVHLWDTSTWQRAGTRFGHENTVFTCAFSVDGRTLVSAAGDGTAKLWDLRQAPSPNPIIVLPNHSMPVGVLPGGKTLLIANHASERFA